MAYTEINVGASDNDGTGDFLRDAFIKANQALASRDEAIPLLTNFSGSAHVIQVGGMAHVFFSVSTSDATSHDAFTLPAWAIPPYPVPSMACTATGAVTTATLATNKTVTLGSVVASTTYQGSFAFALA